MDAADDSYKATWNARSTTLADGMLAVDGSADEAVLALTGAYTAAQLRAALRPAPGEHAFEIGCGVGRLGAQLAPEVASWTGLDIADNMAALARQRVAGVPGATALALDGARLPMADASMDKGWCVAVYIHMDKEDMVLSLREVARVLRPGGRLHLLEHVRSPRR
ncbi:MAG: class I SAM-dependent methyltransferase, partial [Lysobacteraceae bacterium]